VTEAQALAKSKYADAQKIAKQKWNDNLKADPEAYAQYKERQRIMTKLRYWKMKATCPDVQRQRNTEARRKYLSNADNRAKVNAYKREWIAAKRKRLALEALRVHLEERNG
jgi:hypothetical protein